MTVLSRIRAYRPSHTTVVAYLALFVALGGSSYAAITITGKNVKNSSLTGSDIKNSSLTTSDVKNRSLLAVDFKSGQLPAGPRGATGATGPQGGQGPAGTARAYARVTNTGAATINSNFASVSHPSTGIYCLNTNNGLNRTNAVSVTSPDYSDSAVASGDTAHVVNGTSFTGCPTGTSFEVRTYDTSNALKNDGFTLIVG